MAKLTIIEGSADEVVAIAKGLEGSGSTEAAAVAPPAELDPEDKIFVSFEVARKVFSRRPLSAEQKAVVTTLAKAYPNWVPASDLHAATGYSPAQFAGLMGAFGRRFTHTDGFVPNSWLFDANWNYEKSGYDYKLPETVYEAAKAEGLI